MTKAKGKHLEKRLSAVFVKNVTKPGFYADGNTLYLKVDENGAKRWIQRISINNERPDMGLGSTSLVTLAEAREVAAKNRKIARSGGDPLAERKRAAAIPTFEEVAKEVHRQHLPSWRNVKYGQQWLNDLIRHVFPHFGKKKIEKVTTADIHGALTPIWLTKSDTARKILQRIKLVMETAVAQGWRTDNPAHAITRALPKQDRTVKHHLSLPYQDVSDAIAKVHNSGAALSTKLAMEFLVLTASRSGEVRGAKWDEFDMDAKVWTVPAERMKAKKAHRVPLSPRCMEILTQTKKHKDESGFVFPGSISGKPLSDVTLSKLLRELDIECVPHGFRSSFRVWASEQTNIPREVCEFALAHVIKDKAEAAYQRSDLFEKRRKLMDMWAQYLGNTKASVVPIRKEGT